MTRENKAKGVKFLKKRKANEGGRDGRVRLSG